ncbi:hypothetical protein [Dactylosporangium sp. CA-233914]|uniref:hypothetical protein n=1 Tax=Dactylosporangium sp. CA-233914 TaxID=3239934 RepID=UPI003D94853D
MEARAESRPSSSDPQQSVAAAGADSVEQPAAVSLTLDVERGRLSVGVDLDTVLDHDASAVLAFKMPKKSVQFLYDMGDEVRELIAQIGRRYSGREELSLEFEGSEAGAVSGEPKGASQSMAGKISRLLDWQQFIEVTDALRDVRSDSSQDQMHSVLMNYVLDQYVQQFRLIREELQSGPYAGKLLAALLRSHNEVLIDVGLRLAREPGLRAAVQGELLDLVRDDVLAIDIRRRAYAYLQWAQRYRLASTPRSD